MLERTAGCLETGSLRRLLPGSQRPLKSRRMLHSAFWSHGAIDLEHSPLWKALIRGPDIVVDDNDEKSTKSISSTSAGGFLDFLYPS
jgi:pentatricopeptide repeat-containing protein PET309